MSERDAYFKKLALPMQRWVARQGWPDLNSIQKQALSPILSCRGDIIISAATASGKTEAAFLPALSKILEEKTAPKGVQILYISPLKALINDQHRRLDDMTRDTGILVTPWHGDVSFSHKNRLLQAPQGVLLTTPESLESMLINRFAWLKETLQALTYVIIDEYHAFLGTPRGYQLQSQLHRIDNIAGRQVMRIALSATFSDPRAAKELLRPGSDSCQVITDKSGTKDTLAVQLRGYEGFTRIPANIFEKDGIGDKTDEDAPEENSSRDEIASDLFRLLRGSSNLVFCDSRALTEDIAARLQTLSESRHVPNEFFPHHSSLSQDMRKALEERLQDGRWPTTAICTSTLELGIDIKDVQSIAQIEPPVSVSSLRQRLGRSGRRDHMSVLRLFVTDSMTPQPMINADLCESTMLAVAQINLLLKHWYEPPAKTEYAFSTLLQQTLSVIASHGSVAAKPLWDLLCRTGPFSLCDPKTFAAFLKSLGEHDLITQLNDKTLTLGLDGEKLLSKYTFYAAFKTSEDYTVEYNGHAIGRVPISEPLSVDSTFLLAGKGWKVVFFNEEHRQIGVKPYHERCLPLLFSGAGGQVAAEVRREMLRLYSEEEPLPSFLNKTALLHCQNGIRRFRGYDLRSHCMVETKSGLALFPWHSDKTHRTVMLLLRQQGIDASPFGSHLELGFSDRGNLAHAVDAILAAKDISPVELIAAVKNLNLDKFDKYVSVPLKRLAYAHSQLDLDGALGFFKRLKKELKGKR